MRIGNQQSEYKVQSEDGRIFQISKPRGSYGLGKTYKYGGEEKMRKKYFLKNQKNSNINVKNYKINTKKN